MVKDGRINMMSFYKRTLGDRAFNVFLVSLMVFLAAVTIYPFLYVLFASLSNPTKFLTHKGLLVAPLSANLDSYRAVLNNPNVWIGYRNTLFIVTVGTSINLFFTMLASFFLSRKDAILKKPVMIMIVITMFIDGGLIPNYLLIQNLGLYDTHWALILPGAISTMNMIILRTAFNAVPDGLEESARIDGANDFVLLLRIILPLTLPTIAVLGLYYSVSHWNSWFAANIYISSANKFPLQLILRNIVVNNDVEELTMGSAFGESYAMSFTIKYATVMVATLPILAVYPFIQKYFVKGVMIGSLKE